MKTLSLASMFLPDEVLFSLGSLFIVVGALAVMVGGRRFGAGAIAAGFGLALLPALLPMIEAMFTTVLAGMPWWVGPVLLLGIGLATFRLFANVLLGREASAHMTGTLAAGVVTFCFLLPFRCLAAVIRLIRGG